MAQLPTAQQLVVGRDLRPSRFVERCLGRIELKSPVTALDLPAGTGRHSVLLAQLGYELTLADVDPNIVERTVARLGSAGLAGSGLVLDARDPLPFPEACFDLVVVTDFVCRELLNDVGRIVRPGGYLIFESYAARGENWRELLGPGEVEEILGRDWDMLTRKLTPAGPTKREAETARIFAQRRTGPHTSSRVSGRGC